MSNSRYVAKSRLLVSLNTLKLESNENETKLWKFASTMVSRLRDYSNVRFIWGSSAFHSVIQLYIFIKMIITNSKDCFAEKRPSLFQEWTWVLTSQIKIVASPIPRPSLPPLLIAYRKWSNTAVGRPGKKVAIATTVHCFTEIMKQCTGIAITDTYMTCGMVVSEPDPRSRRRRRVW